VGERRGKIPGDVIGDGTNKILNKGKIEKKLISSFI
jgi:hypothetical protein